MKVTLTKILFTSMLFLTAVPFILFSAEEKKEVYSIITHQDGHGNRILECGNGDVIVQGASKFLSVGVIAEQDLTKIRLLLEGNADPNVKIDIYCKEGKKFEHRSALGCAVHKNNPAMVLLLLKHNADVVDSEEDDDSTLLEYAQKKGYLEMVKLLTKASEE